MVSFMSHFELFSRKRSLTSIFCVQRTLPWYSRIDERPRRSFINENREIDSDFGTSPGSNVGSKGAVTQLEVSGRVDRKGILTGNVRAD